MATNFPNSPSNGATHTFGGTTYTYNSSKGVWQASADAIAVRDNPPSNPETGELWFDSSVAKTYIYYNDGSSSNGYSLILLVDQTVQMVLTQQAPVKVQ